MAHELGCGWSTVQEYLIAFGKRCRAGKWVPHELTAENKAQRISICKSPDLNIIEPLWSYLKGRVSKCKPRNIEELWKRCEEQWAMIPDHEIKKLYKIIPRRIQAALRKKCLNTRY